MIPLPSLFDFIPWSLSHIRSQTVAGSRPKMQVNGFPATYAASQRHSFFRSHRRQGRPSRARNSLFRSPDTADSTLPSAAFPL
jgi:hypothetical protein